MLARVVKAKSYEIIIIIMIQNYVWGNDVYL